mgnify:CR=1 FL=1
MMPFPTFTPGAKILELFSNTATANSATIAWPGGIRAGDLAVLVDEGENTGAPAPTSVIPSGFTSIADNTLLSVRTILSYKLLVGTESGNITGMAVASSESNKRLLIFRLQGAISSVVVGTFANVFDANNPAAQTTTLVGLVCPLVYIAVGGNRTGPASTFTTETPALDNKYSDTANVVGYKIYNSNPQNHTVDIADLSTNNWLFSGYIRVVD